MGVVNASGGGGSGVTGLLWTPAVLSDWHQIISAPNRVSIVNDPIGTQGKVLQVDCNNADIEPITPTGDPRAQLLTPALLYPGADLWLHFKILFPVGFPAFVAGNFFQFFEIFAPPFAGSSSVSLFANVEGGKERVFWQRNSQGGFDIPWEGNKVPIVRGEWIDIYVRNYFNNIAFNGFVEMWYQGVQLEFFNPETSFNPGAHEATKQLIMSTEDLSNNEGPCNIYLGQYRKHNTPGMEGTTTVYITPPKLGLAKSAVT